MKWTWRKFNQNKNFFPSTSVSFHIKCVKEKVWKKRVKGLLLLVLPSKLQNWFLNYSVSKYWNWIEEVLNFCNFFYMRKIILTPSPTITLVSLSYRMDREMNNLDQFLARRYNIYIYIFILLIWFTLSQWLSVHAFFVVAKLPIFQLISITFSVILTFSIIL